MTLSGRMKEPNKGLIIAAFAALYIIWGSTYLAIKFAIVDIPPFFLVAARFLSAGAVLLAGCLYKGEKLPSIKSLLLISVGGVLMLFVGNGAVSWSEQYVPSGLAAIVVATVPLWFIILDKKQWKYHFSNKRIIAGVLIGFAGVMMLFSDKGSVSLSAEPLKLLSFFVLIAGTIGWAIGSLYSKYKTVEGTVTMKAAIQMIAAGIVALLVALATHQQDHLILSKISLEAILALLYLIIMGSLVGYMSYIWLLSVRPASLVGTYAYVNPIVAVFLGWLFANEPITLAQAIALIVIVAGVVMVNLRKETKKADVGEIV